MFGWKIRQDLNYTVSTFAPPILWPPCFKHGKQRTTGYGAVSMWKQRAYRWYRNYPRRIFFEIYLFFTYNCRPKPNSKYYYIKLLFKNISRNNRLPYLNHYINLSANILFLIS